MTVAGGDVVGYRCDHCAHAWTRLVEADLDVHFVVRVELPDATLYGDICQVEGDRVQVRGAGGEWLLWAERWRVTSY